MSSEDWLEDMAVDREQSVRTTFFGNNEAVDAIQELNEKPPLYLRVRVAHGSKGSKSLSRVKPPKIAAQVETPVFAPATVPTLGRRFPGDFQDDHIPRAVGRGMNLRRSAAVLKAFRAHARNQLVEDTKAWSPGPADIVERKYMYFPRDLHEEANTKLLDNLTATIKSDGKRIVSMGRGYYKNAKKQRQAANKFWHHELDGIYEFGKDIEVQSSPCCRCRVATVQRCTQCGAYYCSRVCQLQDWHNHKNQCKFRMCIDVIPDEENGEKRIVSLLPLSAPLKAMESQSKWSLGPVENVVDAMEEGTKGVFEVARCSPDSVSVFGTLCCAEVQDVADDLLVKLPIILQDSPTESDFSPQRGAMVAVFEEGCWWRGCVLSQPSASESSDEYKVALCEVARVVSAKKAELKEVEPDFARLPQLGVEGKVINSSLKGNELWSRYLQMRSDVVVTVDEKKEGSLVCSVASEEGVALCQMAFQRWDPAEQLQQCEKRVVEVEHGSSVALTAYHSQHALFVRPTGKEHAELRNTVLQQVAFFHVNGLPLTRPPRRGEMVACECPQDGNYYRAIVWATNPDESGKYKVWFVDYGNWANVERCHMKELPDSVKNNPYLAAKVALKGVGDEPLTVAAALFLNELLEKEVMTIKFGTSAEAGVDLYTRDGTHVNDKIRKLLQPNWKTASDNEAIYGDKVPMLEDLVTVPLVEEGEGEWSSSSCSVIVLHLLAEKGIILCCRADSPVIPVITTSLASKINEFCESPVANRSYNPRLHEICLARLSDGTWQRAMAVESTKAGSVVVFLDYGDTEEMQFQSMRRILPEFLDTPMLVSACLIKGLPSVLSGELKEKLKTIIRPHSVITLKNVRNIERGTAQFEAEMPEILSALRAESLI